MERYPNQSTSLVSNITSSLFETAAKMHRSGIVVVYVEGYEDIAFWRSILDKYETKERKFEISTPARSDLAKGKRVVLNFAPQAGDHLLLCVDSDFDYLLGDHTDQSRLVNNNHYVIQTYTYSIENLLCYPPSLNNITVKATKNDAKIFDFECFMAEYSKIIYPLFGWYLLAAKIDNPGIFPLKEFRNAVKINHLVIDDDGEQTLEWLERQVARKLKALEYENRKIIDQYHELEAQVRAKGVRPSNIYAYIQGHTLMDNVVKVLLEAVCDVLRKQWVDRIMSSSREGLPLHNELSYYNNSLRDVDTLLLDNVLYTDSEHYKMIEADLHTIFEGKSV